VNDLTGLIAEAFKAACRDEIAAPKPGNVHAISPGHRMTAADFVLSADAAAVPLSTAGAAVGRRILDAVEATLAAVGMNTNLGIILLCAPLAAAAERGSGDLRAVLAAVLEGLSREDANLAFQAIVRASPGGLGRAARHDVSEPATVTLREAMAEAADRDRIARQYVTAFEDIFAFGLPLLDAAVQRGSNPAWCTLMLYLGFLSAFPDTHIVRKHGVSTAEEVRLRAREYARRIGTGRDCEMLRAEIMEWDAELKQRGINPGTSADLTVATIFARRLQRVLLLAHKSGSLP
jgi:triphosphoribosyl-dephospho-CoA synthase